MKIEQKKLEKSQLEITFELTPEEFEEHIRHAVLHLKQHVKVDGFRQGHVPESIVKEKIGKENLLMEAGDHAVKHVYSDYILENKLEPIYTPEIQILKIAEGNPLLFKAKITVLPDVVLPDYKEIVKKIKGKEISVTEEEVKDALNYLQKSRAKFSQKEGVADSKDFVEIAYQSKDINQGKEVQDQFVLGEGGFMKGFEENIIGMKAGEEKEFKATFPETSPQKNLAGKEGDFKVKLKSVQKMELLEINDEFAKEMGAFENLDALKSNIKEGLTIEKTEEEKQRKRGEILEKIAEKTEADIPNVLIEHEKTRSMEELKHKIEHIKITFEDYLASIKQTEEALKETFQKEAEKRIKNYLVLRQLGKNENIVVSDKEIEEETDKVLKGQTLRQAQGEIDINQFREYTKGVLYNEKVFEKLESFSK